MTLATPVFENDLINRLPHVRGRLTANAPLGKNSWLRVGGPAEVLFKPADLSDLQHFLQNLDHDIPVTVLGVASNMIIRDGGIPGVVIRLLKDFTKITAIDETTITAGAGATDRALAMTAAKSGIGGLEFFSGIPGTIGGAVRMNAGCYGHETKDVMITATCIDRQGVLHSVSPAELDMQYRKTALPQDWTIVSATFKGMPARPDTIMSAIDDIRAKRENSQPIREKTGGSTFANPQGESAWKIIDAAGCRGLRIGGAQMSEKHCNFMINTGHASAHDLETLGETVRRRVREHSNINLRWEIRRMGEFLPGQTLPVKDN